MAHPDDAEFLCAGTLIRLAQAGWEVHIATVAAGDCGTTTETPGHQPHGGRRKPGRSAALIRADVSLPRRARRFGGLRQADVAEVLRSVPPRGAAAGFHPHGAATT